MDGSERLPRMAIARMRACEHRAVTKGAAQATESGAHHDATRPKQSRLEPDSMFQRFPVPAAMAAASSGVGSGKSSSNSKAAKRKKQLGEVEAATAVVRGQDARSDLWLSHSRF